MAQVRLPEWMNGTKGPARTTGLMRPRRGFLEKNIEGVSFLVREMVAPRVRSPHKGLLQSIDQRARVGGTLLLVLSGAFIEEVVPLAGLLVLTLVLAFLSSVSFGALFKRVLPALILAAVVAVPLFFDLIGGQASDGGAAGVEVLGYRVALTAERIGTAGLLMTRVAAMVTPVAVLLLSTRESDLFKGLQGLPVPSFFVTALFMTFRYVFVLLKVVEDTSLSRRARTIDPSRLGDAQRWFASRAGLLVERSLRSSREVAMAMSSRGFTGRIRTLKPNGLKARDYLWIGFVSFVFFISIGL